MQFQIDLRYPASADQAMKMLVDRAYFERKYQKLDVGDFLITQHESTSDRFAIGFQFRAAGQTRVPDFARKIVGDSIRVRQSEYWTIAKRKGGIDIEIAGAPASVHADMALVAESPTRSVLKLDWTIRCGIPLLGGKVEKLIAEDVHRRSEADGAVSIALLELYQ